MSYILDALKRADAERERGTVPGLRAQPIPATSARTAHGARPLQRWVLFACVLFVALLAALAWRMGAQGPAQPVAPVTPATPAANNTASLPATAMPAPAPTPAPRQTTSPTPAVVVAPPIAAQPRPAVPPAKSPAASAPEVRPAALAELPDDLRRQLPATQISGSIYSENPAQRMVTIGSQVFQEGDKPAPDLVLEQIGRKAAVFNFRGTRYTLSY